MLKYSILMHEPDDDVAVAVEDIQANSEVGVATIEGQEIGRLVVLNDVPLGHKVAVRDLDVQQNVRKYGRPIGHATRPIHKGEHVHVHNIKSNRW